MSGGIFIHILTQKLSVTLRGCTQIVWCGIILCMKSGSKKKSILLVEDEVMLSHLLMPRLEKEGYIVTLAEDGEEAIQEIRSQKFDLILFDLCLPRQSGFETMEQLMNEKDIAQGPIIVFSNLSSTEDMERAKQLGASDYLVKTNTTHDELLEHISTLLGSKNAEEE